MVFEEMLRDERAEGRAEGIAEGRAEGRTEESKETLLLYLKNLGTVSKALSDRIQSQQELEVLKRWTQIAFQSKSLEEFEEKISL